LTVATAGIGAALIGNAVTRFAIFVATGHAGQVTPSAAADELADQEERKLTPVGWEVVGDQEPGAGTPRGAS